MLTLLTLKVHVGSFWLRNTVIVIIRVALLYGLSASYASTYSCNRQTWTKSDNVLDDVSINLMTSSKYQDDYGKNNYIIKRHVNKDLDYFISTVMTSVPDF